ncbi:MAG TPA: DCC1-like thiol-disulfide oxidoreductase family protein, partial [Candidatus Obscuribacter sp.]|nr:DCC1-like thiol-disulfide oxidoreductase family protein [Candidatus Obscuribacter sp.]
GGNIIFFDGVCGLCDHFVQLVLDHDKTGKFLFCPLQSDFAKQKLAAHGIKSSELGSVVLILACGEPAEAAYTKSEAALRILGALDKSTPLVLLKYSLILPAFLRDFGYDLVASNRYKVFGRLETCRIPLPEERQRFLDL